MTCVAELAAVRGEVARLITEAAKLRSDHAAEMEAAETQTRETMAMVATEVREYTLYV